ncbi:MAG TPA: terminase family protein [Allosphingosinicella sp.]|nr:terminase family protein [Allosphingosinicella sp.]
MAQGVGGTAFAEDVDDYEDLLDFVAMIEDPGDLERFVRLLPTPVRRRLVDGWGWRAHAGQRPPAGADFAVWLLRAGRGFGKTLAGAKWVGEKARACPSARIAIVGATIEDSAAVMVEGPSGLVASARTGEAPLWVPSRRALYWPSGAEGHVYSAAAPEKLRGPEHDFAWCDELAKWPAAAGAAAWDNLVMGLRRGERPQIVVTTTPRAAGLLRRVRGLGGTVETHGRTADNPHLPDAAVAGAYAAYGGTRLGRQELDAEMFDEVEGALWTREGIESSRSGTPSRDHRRIVVGVDPPASVEGACGIVVCGLGQDGIGYVLADVTEAGLTPEGWARKVAAAAEGWRAHRVVAEANNGGRMVESVLRGAAAGLAVKLVHASEGKSARAEPVAALFEGGRARLAGAFPELEDQLCGLVLGGGYEGPGASPDRADAMVWALTELMLGPGRAEPRVTLL